MEDKPLKRVEYPCIGWINIGPGRNKSRINIYLDEDGEVTVTYPKKLTRKYVLSTLEQKVDWINDTRRKIKGRPKRRYVFDNIDRKMAGTVLRHRLNMYAERHGFSYNRVFIRNQTTRWGSQSSRGNINLNMKLVRLPVEMMDYVILHELVHTRVRNHSSDFWSELERFCPDYKRIKKRFREYRMTPPR